MTTAQAAETLEVTTRQVRYYVEDGRLEAVKIGRDWHITPRSVEKLANERKES